MGERNNTFVLRLYRMHDLDLLYLVHNPAFNFPKFCFRALENHFFEEEPFFADVHDFTTDYYCRDMKYSRAVKISFNKHKEVLDKINEIPDGYRGQYIKQVLRNHLFDLNLSFYNHGNVRTRMAPEGLPTEDFFVVRKKQKEVETTVLKKPRKVVEKIRKTEPKKETPKAPEKTKELETSVEEVEQTEESNGLSNDEQNAVFDALDNLMKGF